MVDITKDAEHIKESTLEPQFDENLKTTYPTAKEELIHLLNRYMLKNSKVMLCVDVVLCLTKRQLRP